MFAGFLAECWLEVGSDKQNKTINQRTPMMGNGTSQITDRPTMDGRKLFWEVQWTRLVRNQGL
jgi:hypothetical protein